MCGFWLTQHLHQQQQQQQQQQQHQHQQQAEAAPVLQGCRLPAALGEFISSCKVSTQQQQQQQQQQQNLLVVDFGSMGAIGLIPDAATLLHVLLGALRALGTDWRAVLLTGGWQPLLQAAAAAAADAAATTTTAAAAATGTSRESLPQARQALVDCADITQPAPTRPQQQQQQQQQQARLKEESSFVRVLPQLFVQHVSLECHHLLVGAADVLLHHGGSGTTAAALAAGVPQLMCPLQFDQYYWVGPGLKGRMVLWLWLRLADKSIPLYCWSSLATVYSVFVGASKILFVHRVQL
jgi:hypothetical protein